jgi:hypothetical protein
MAVALVRHPSVHAGRGWRHTRWPRRVPDALGSGLYEINIIFEITVQIRLTCSGIQGLGQKI